MPESSSGGVAARTASVSPSELRTVITASSVGNVIEWYDFFIFGTLAVIVSPYFFPSDNPTTSLLLGLATFGTGFAMRPFGAVFFGRLGDLIGRKRVFIATIMLMGAGTALIGVLPGHAQIGIAAPILLVALRLIQGLSVGGEYGGANLYIAEYAPDGKRGRYMSWLQITPGVAVLLALLVVLVTRSWLGEDAFIAWGWRLPFLSSVVLLLVGLWMRVRTRETPVFSGLRAQNRTSTSPLKDALGSRDTRRMMLVVLFGPTAGVAVIWYTSHFYVQTFLTTQLEVAQATTNLMVAVGVGLGIPFILVFGRLSDRIGRKPLMMAGILLSAIAFLPVYWGISHFSRPLNIPAVIALILVMHVFNAMLYGPVAAFLAEVFTTKVRYTALSLPWQIGNGYIGGFLPLIATSLAIATGNMYAGLAYPITIALVGFVVCMLFVRESHDVKIWDEIDRQEQTPSI